MELERRDRPQFLVCFFLFVETGNSGLGLTLKKLLLALQVRGCASPRLYTHIYVYSFRGYNPKRERKERQGEKRGGGARVSDATAQNAYAHGGETFSRQEHPPKHQDKTERRERRGNQQKKGKHKFPYRDVNGTLLFCLVSLLFREREKQKRRSEITCRRWVSASRRTIVTATECSNKNAERVRSQRKRTHGRESVRHVKAR